MSTQPSFGWLGPAPVEFIVTNRTGSAVAVGDVEMLDIQRIDAASTGNVIGSSAGGMANIVVPTYDGTTDPISLSCEIFGVVQKAAADDGVTTLRVRGYCATVAADAAVVLRTSPCVAGDGTEKVHVATPVTCATDAAIARKVIFLPLTAIGSAGTTDGFFDGINGFGTVLASTDLT